MDDFGHVSDTARSTKIPSFRDTIPQIDITCNSTDDTKLSQEINNNVEKLHVYASDDMTKFSELSQHHNNAKKGLSAKICSLGNQIHWIRVELVS